VPAIFRVPHHPYTAALLAAIPEHNRGARRLASLPGMVPGGDDRPAGCLFEPRCAYAVEACAAARPALVPYAARDARVRCIKPLHAQVAQESDANGDAP
jgi:dipeptide transport system ATP-binding protein